VGVEVQADAQADLVRARVGLEAFHQRQDGIAREGGHMGQQIGLAGGHGTCLLAKVDLCGNCGLPCSMFQEKMNNE
jgi:hypothetical protein